MGKRRNAEKISYGGADGSATTDKNNGGGGSMDGRFLAFEFADDDLLVETESRKTLAKFGIKSPSKKPLHHRQSLDKYAFLECFSRGTVSQQRASGNDILEVEIIDSVSQERTIGPDVTMSLGSVNYESRDFSVTKHQGFECTCGAKSCAPRSRKPGCFTAGKKHNRIMYVDSDEDEWIELGLLSSSSNLAENEGSPEQQSSEYGINNNDCEAVVVVNPCYVKYGKTYYTRCLLTFSQRCIRLEGSPLCDRKKTHCLEWSTFDILNIEYQQCESVKAEVVNLYLRSKDTTGDVTSTGNSGSLELEFVVLDHPLWSEKEKEIKSLDLKYKAAWKSNVSEYISNEFFEDMVYPGGDPDAVFISRRDIELLQPGTFINDTIIDFYIKYLSNKTKLEERHRFHFFNTFFFRKLVAMEQDLSRAWEERDAFKSVRKWTRNVNIFEKDYIFIPVNFRLHWSLIIICHPGEIANLRDKVMDGSSKVPCILHMDSLRGSHSGFENLIRSYLWEEWKERGTKDEEDISGKFLNLDFVSLELPQQENFSDCGLFLLHYAERFLEEASNFNSTIYFDFISEKEKDHLGLEKSRWDVTFVCGLAQNIPQALFSGIDAKSNIASFLRYKGIYACSLLNQDWFLSAEVSLKKRDHIRKLIHRIVEDNAPKDPLAARSNTHLQSSLINEGGRSAKYVQENSVKESCSGIKFSSSDDFCIKGQQSFVPMLEQRNIDKKVADECFERYKLLVPINQFNSLNLPMEETFEKQNASPQEDIARRHQPDKMMPPCYQLTSFRTGEMKDTLETSKTYSEKSPIIIDIQNEEDYVPEGASPIERQKGRYKNSSILTEDLTACVVEDSEDESETERIGRTRRSCSLISPVSSIRSANCANTSLKMERKQRIAEMESTRL